MKSDRINEFLKIMQRLHKNSMRFKSQTGIPHTEFHILQYLVNHASKDAGVSITELSEHIEVSKPAVSQFVNALEEKGLVERVTTKKDRRVVYVAYTEAGYELVKNMRHVMNARVEAILDKMGDEDAAEFLRLFDKFSLIMGEF